MKNATASQQVGMNKERQNKEMLKIENIIKDIENNLVFGSGYINTLTYNLGDKSCLRIIAEKETIDFKYITNGIEVIKTSVPYEMFWETAIETEVIFSVMETVFRVGELGKEQFNE